MIVSNSQGTTGPGPVPEQQKEPGEPKPAPYRGHQRWTSQRTGSVTIP
jgi:hypothetical protein